MSSDNTKGRFPARPIQTKYFVSRQHNCILRLLSTRQQQSTPRLRLRYRTGFSLLELLIVINLLGLMLTLSWPSMQEMLARQHAQSYIRQFQQHLQFARIMAISSGRVVTFCPLHDNKCLNQWWQIPIHINQQQKNKEQVLIRICRG